MNQYRRVVSGLDFVSASSVAGYFASIAATLRSRERVRIRKTSMGWEHRWRDKVIVSGTWWSTPESLVSTHYGTFFHAYRPRPGDVVLDIGAGIGTEVIELSRLVGSNGLVIALEPNPNLFMRLLWAITEMKLSNVVALPLGLGAHRGPMDLSVDEDSDPDMVGGSLIGNSLVTLRVAITTLPALLDSLGVPRVNYAKVNIEGAERDVIKASGRALLRIDNWCISCHDFLPDEEVHTLVDVLGAMHAVGLKPFLNPNAASGTASSCYVYTQSDSSSDDSPAVDLEA